MKYYLDETRGFNFEKNKKNFLLFVLAAACFALFYYMRTSYFALRDDLLAYTWVVSGDALKQTIQSAYSQGRIIFLVTNFLEYLPMFAQNMVVYKLFGYISVLLVCYAMWVLVSRHFDKTLAFLVVLFYVAFSSVDGWNNILVSYVFWRHVDIAISILSFERLLTYLKKEPKEKKYLIQSVVMYFITACCYENFVLYGVSYFLVILVYHINTRDGKKLDIKGTIMTTIPYFLGAVVYAVMYYGWRMVHPSAYTGNTVDPNLEIFSSLKAMFIYAISRFPGIPTVKQYLPDKIWDGMCDMELWEYAIVALITVAVFILLKNIKVKLSFKCTAVVCGICLVTMFLTTVLHSITYQYKGWIGEGYYWYVPSSTSYIVMMIAFGIAVVFVYQWTHEAKWMMALILVCTFAVGVLTFAHNHIYANFAAVQTAHYEGFDHFVKSDEIKEIEDNAVIYVPGAADYSVFNEDMDRYSNAFNGKNLSFVIHEEEIDWSRPVYVYKLDTASEVGWFARVDENLLTDEVTLFFEHKESRYGIILDKGDDDSTIQINDKEKSCDADVAIFKLSGKNETATISCDDMNILKSSAYLPEVKLLYNVE